MTRIDRAGNRQREVVRGGVRYIVVRYCTGVHIVFQEQRDRTGNVYLARFDRPFHWRYGLPR